VGLKKFAGFLGPGLSGNHYGLFRSDIVGGPFLFLIEGFGPHLFFSKESQESSGKSGTCFWTRAFEN
jgi:hypothetical protein